MKRHSYPIVDAIYWNTEPSVTLIGHCDEGCHTEWLSMADGNEPKVGEWLTVVEPSSGDPWVFSTPGKPEFRSRPVWVDIFLEQVYYRGDGTDDK